MSQHYQKIYNLTLAGNIIVGIDSLNRLGEFTKQFTRGNALIITDKTIQQVGILKKVEDQIIQNKIPYDMFTEVESDPSIECATNVTHIAREKEYSLIIGVGGGSSLDMAKIASGMSTNRGDVSEYIGINLLKKKGTPLILIPTTSGTGSEVTANAIISTKDDQMKKAIVSNYLLPTLSIVDPRLTVSCPPKVTAYTGFDALSHNIEGLMTLRSNPLTDALVLKATELIFKYLPLAYANGSNLEARYYMATASLFGGMVIQGAGVCGGHAAAYSFAVKHTIPHGMSCAIALPYLMEFNSTSCPEKIAAIGYTITGSKEHSLKEAGKIAIRSVLELMKKIGIPTNLREVGIKEKDLSAIARDILKVTRLLKNNPRSITENDAIQLFTRMWEGTLDLSLT